MHDIAFAYLFLEKTYRFFLGNFFQNLFLTNLNLYYIVFKQFNNQHVSCF